MRIVLFIFLFFILAYATDPVKIVYNSGTPPLKFTDKNKKANGMLIDIWKLWAKKNNIKIKFIEASWKDTLQMIQDGRADIHAGIYYTKERDKFLDYSKKPLYSNKSYFFYDKNIPNITSIKDLKPYVIGIGNGYPRKYMKEYYPDFFIKAYKNSDQLSEALINNKVKVILSSMPTFVYHLSKNYIKIKQYKFSDSTLTYAKNYYGAVKKGNSKLLKLIDDSFKKISNKELKSIELNWTSKINEHYLNNINSSAIFTKNQLNYMKKKKVIKMCVDPAWLPFEAIENGKHIGMVADMYNHFSHVIPIPIKLIPTKTWHQSIEFIKQKKCDILSAAVYTKNRASYLNFTKPYLIFPQAIATKDKEKFIENISDIIHKPIGVVKDSAVIELLRENYPDINLVEVNNISDGLFKVSNNELYGFINTSATLSYAISKEGLTNLKIASKVDIDYPIRIAIRKDEKELFGVFDNLISHIIPNHIKKIKNRWINIKVQEKIDYSMLYKAFFGFIVIVSFFIFWNRRLEKEIQRRKEIEEQLKIQKKQLEKETKKAQSATVAKSEFLAKMSHEIRTPMNAVLGMLYLLKKTNLTASQESYISKATNAANSLLTIINDILDISKVEAGKFDIIEEEFVFNDMLQETMDIMSFKANEKGCELLAYYDFSIPKIVISDSNRIKQILTNIISNAIKFTDDGEIVVSTKLLKDNSKKLTIMFCIKDTGIGIEKKALDKLFHDFSQADNSITRKFGGTGLGLTISKKLVNMLDGDIWVEESKVGIGSTFCFTITVKKAKNAPTDIYNFPQELKKLNILIIDDNIIACDILKKMLNSFGFDVDIANSGYDGLEAIEKNNYDIVFLDYKMPNMNGIETYKKIKSLPKSTPKTIMITAHVKNELLDTIEELGIDSYLVKPTSPSTLYDTIVDLNKQKISQNTLHIKQSKSNECSFIGVKILLAEDNQLNQDFAKELLQSVNISVDIANDGLEAVELVKHKIYDIVLMDIQMPNMDGLTATKHIRAMGSSDEYFKKLPIIALSANALSMHKQLSLESGLNEHITKPIDPKELFDTLKKFLKNINLNVENNSISNYNLEVNSKILDTQEAIRRLNGNETAYIKLLKQFAKKYTTIYETINKLRHGDIDILEKKIHEIKGVLGNLGAKKVFLLLQNIDTILKTKNMP